MSITEVNDKISEVIGLLDEIEHIDSCELEPVRTILEDAQEKLDKLSNQYGDDEYGDDYDYDEDDISDDDF
jgi:hypothetical protein